MLYLQDIYSLTKKHDNFNDLSFLLFFYFWIYTTL